MSDEGLYIDHVIYGVVDIEAAAARLAAEHGLNAIPGGLHLGGTTNMFVPLRPPLFLELLGVGDPGKADGAWLSQVLNGRDRPLWWVLGVDSLEDAAARRGLPIQQGEGDTADGVRVSFRSAGMARFPLPFFIDYPVDPAQRLEHWAQRLRRADHANTPGGFTFVEVGEPPELLDAWLGDHGLPVHHAGGPVGIRAFGIDTERGEVVIR